MKITERLLPKGRPWAEGWPEGHPSGVTWHWTAGGSLAGCYATIGPVPGARDDASAHYAVGRTLKEGIDQYVLLDDRSFHAGKNQTLRGDGKPRTGAGESASRMYIGVETVHLGWVREGNPATPGTAAYPGVDCSSLYQIPPWTEACIEGCVVVARAIIARWPHIRAEDHHGHGDLCPNYKVDPLGFPFARVLSEAYGVKVPDVWGATRTFQQRQAALNALSVRRPDLQIAQLKVDGVFGNASKTALRVARLALCGVADSMWPTAFSWRLHEAGALPSAA